MSLCLTVSSRSEMTRTPPGREIETVHVLVTGLRGAEEASLSGVAVAEAALAPLDPLAMLAVVVRRGAYAAYGSPDGDDDEDAI
jgi:hypothetical protein